MAQFTLFTEVFGGFLAQKIFGGFLAHKIFGGFLAQDFWQIFGIYLAMRQICTIRYL
jgi:hypothetical protein